MLFAIAFVAQFVVGGLTGIMLATAPIDWQVTDSYFVVAHFHYVLFGGTPFAIMAAFYYWFPKMTGRLLSERIGLWHFALMLLGFNLTFGAHAHCRACWACRAGSTPTAPDAAGDLESVGLGRRRDPGGFGGDLLVELV